MNPINTELPEEIKQLIAKLVDNKSLTRCRQACKAWLAVLTPLCFKRLPIFRNLIYYKEEHMVYLRNILQYVKDEAISLSFNNGRFPNNVHLLGEIKNLQKLELDICSLPDTYLDALSTCPNLTSLKVIIGSKTGLAYNIDHMEHLTKLQSLKNLEISGYFFNEEYNPIYLQHVINTPNLESIPTIPISNDEQMNMIINSPLKSRLKAIYLDGGLVSHDMIRSLAEMSNLAKLRISYSNIDDASFSLLGNLCNLRQVCLESLDNVTDLGLAAAKKWTNLEKCRFQLNSNYSFISNTSSIKHLDVNNCLIEGGLASLRKLTNLEVLLLGSIDGLSASDFMDVPLNNLTRLQVSLPHLYITEIEKHLDLTKAPSELARNMYVPYQLTYEF